MKNGKLPLFFIFLLFSLSNLSGINFDNLTLSNDDRVLFSAEVEAQKALFVSSITGMSTQQLTAFPEKLYLVENGRTVLAANRFGVTRIPVTGGLPSLVPGYPSFSAESAPVKGRVNELAASADGNWILYIEPISAAYGNLILVDVSSGAKRIVTERIELPSLDFPVKWSPDSRLFVYSKGGRLFYFPIINDLSLMIDERFRIMGSGGINSVLWGQQGEFFYLAGNILYKINSPELFTRTIYGNFLSAGRAVSSLPLDFDFNFDRFWIAPDSGSILINKTGKSFFIFSLGENQDSGSVLPHTAIPSGAENINVFWPSSGQITVIFSLRNETVVWRIRGSQITNLSSNVPLSSTGALSPDGSRIVFWGTNGFELWDFSSWRLIQRFGGEPVYSCAWINNTQLVLGNGKFINEVNISGSNITQRQICLSGVDEFGFETGSSRILAKIENNWFATDSRNPWVPAQNPQLRQVSLSSERYRVYLEPQFSGLYKNIPMVRSANSTRTVPLVSGYSENSAGFSSSPMQIALCFDLYDDDTGLFSVLTALNRYGVKATFFLNGDFIRRYPAAAAFIAETGHETASLFYAPIDFSDSRYRITQDFITQGLARNEDEFFLATGKELSLLWHPPFYRSSNFIKSAAQEAGYRTVERTVDPGDWLSREDSVRHNIRQNSAADMIEQIAAKKENRAVIPVRLGLLPGGRDDYLFQRIDVLLDALIRSGAEIVPVSRINNAP